LWYSRPSVEGVRGGPWFVRLWNPGGPSVALGPYENPANGRSDAEKVRGFVASVIQEARRG